MSYSLRTLLELIEGKVVNCVHELDVLLDKNILLGPSDLKDANQNQIAFCFSKKYEKALSQTQAGVLIVSKDLVSSVEKQNSKLWSSAVIVVCTNPYLAMAKTTELFAQKLSCSSHLPQKERLLESKIHPSAVIDRSVELGSGIQVGAHCVLEEGVKVGAGSVLYPGCFVGRNTIIGQDSVIFAGVKLYESVVLGERVRLHSGVVIGADGFGFVLDKKEQQVNGHQKIYHFGGVIIGNDVEIGANSCVDRGTFSDTIIGDQVKIDNLVQVGHNVQIEQGAVICGAAAVAGNCKIGSYVYVGGLTGIANQAEIGSGAMLGAHSLISKSVPAKEMAVGNPQRTQKDHFKLHAILNKLIKEKKNKTNNIVNKGVSQ